VVITFPTSPPRTGQVPFSTSGSHGNLTFPSQVFCTTPVQPGTMICLFALASFALSEALPPAFDYSEASVAMSLSAFRRSRSSFRTLLARRLPFAVHHSSWAGCERDVERHSIRLALIPHRSNSTMTTRPWSLSSQARFASLG
jgi:hypothetical protein